MGEVWLGICVPSFRERDRLRPAGVVSHNSGNEAAAAGWLAPDRAQGAKMEPPEAEAERALARALGIAKLTDCGTSFG
jgi:hypothetical protein